MNKFTRYLKRVVYLEDDIDRQMAAAAIKKNIAFSGPNVFILACAIVIASVGLNVNSIPVIIGAMLISPVMGPIIGFGLGLGTNDTGLLKNSLNNFLIMVVISIAAASLYFLVSPLRLSNPTEILARTRPTIYDVLIATFGGAAGMLEHARKERGTVLSGVAIATALMPPLCTVGYGIATLKLAYILGALYLFLINTFFIAISTFLVVKFLGFKSSVTDVRLSRRNRIVVGIVLLIMIVPSIFSAVWTIQENNFVTSADHFVQNNKTIGSSYIYDYHVNLDDRKHTLDIYLAGEELDPTAKQILLTNAQSYGLHSDQIILHEEAAVRMPDTAKELISDMNSYYLNTIQDLNRRIVELEVELAKYKGAEAAAAQPDSLSTSSGNLP